MKFIKQILLIVIAVPLLDACGNTDKPKQQTRSNSNRLLKVACVGDSITAGTGLSNPAQSSYPARLRILLGDGWQVNNFGISGTTVTKSGDRPFRSTSAFTSSHNSNPDIVVIMLGTNDAKPKNWVHKAHFVSDYVEFINTYKTLPSSPKIYICYPPPVYGTVAGITDSRIRNEIIPKIQEVAVKTGAYTIDLYTKMSGKQELFPDKIHPNADGAKLISQIVYENIF